MPARHRHHHSSEQRKSFTITRESCSHSPGIGVHNARWKPRSRMTGICNGVKKDAFVEFPIKHPKWDSGIRAIRDDLQKAATEMRASRKASDRYDKWPESRKRVETCNESWKWRSSVDRGQRVWETHKSVAFRVSLETYERALAITNALALGARARGFSIRNDRELGRVVLVGHNAAYS
jgi:hypothetical protein